jgi:hypothetical protein
MLDCKLSSRLCLLGCGLGCFGLCRAGLLANLGWAVGWDGLVWAVGWARMGCELSCVLEWAGLWAELFCGVWAELGCRLVCAVYWAG